MLNTSKTRLRAFAYVAVLLAVLNTILVLVMSDRLRDNAEMVTHTYKVQNSLSSIFATLIDAETGQRGYIITGKQEFLEPYDSAIEKINPQLVILRNLTADNSTQQAKLNEIETVVDARMDKLQRGVTLANEAKFDEARDFVATRGGKEDMDAIRRLIDEMVVEENKLLTIRADQYTSSFWMMIAASVLGGLATLGAVLAFVQLSTRYTAAHQRLNQELYNSNELLSTTLSSIGEGVITTDLNGNVTMINPVAEVHTGWTLSEANGKPIQEVFHIVHETSRNIVVNPLLTAIETKKSVALANHTVLIRRDGCEVPIEDMAAPIVSKKGDIVGGVLVFHDVSEKRTQQTEILRREQIYRDTFDLAQIGIAHVTPDGHFHRINRKFCDIIGYDCHELLSKHFRDITHPDDRHSNFEHFQKMLRGESELYQTEKRYIAKDGRTIWANLTSSLIRNKDGSPSHFLSMIDDITTRRETASRFTMLANNISQFAWITDASGWIHWYNNRWYEYTGTTFEQMQGWGWKEVHHPDHLERVVEKFRHCINSGEPWEDTFPLRSKDGQYRWFLSRAHPIRDANGTIVNWFGSNTDITEINEAREEAERASRSRGEFLANMSHEIRTPMTAILGHADILAEFTDDADNLQSVDTIRRNGKYLLQIINDILDLSKIDAGKLNVGSDRVRPDVILADIESLMSVRAHDRAIGFNVSIEGLLPDTIATDAVRLRQILLNLVGNAIKFTEQGKIDLNASYVTDRNMLEFKITDTGIGIDQEHLDRIFEPFTQADSSTARTYEGTGLGLAISRRLARALGRDISVSSHVGVGSCFTLLVSVRHGHAT
jgi:PAS domain S-box-containing protein